MYSDTSTPHQSQRGLSAIEVLVVLAVLTILVALAWPKFSAWRTNALKQDLVEAMDAGDREGTLRALRRGAAPDGWSGSSPHFCLYCQTALDGDLEMARLVFSKDGSDTRDIPRHQPPLLNVAVARNHVEMATLLLEHGGDINGRVRYGYDRYSASGSPGGALQSIRELIQAYYAVGEPMLDSQHTTIKTGLAPYVIPASRFAETVKDSRPPIPSDIDKRFWINTLLHDAVILKNPAMLRLLLDHGVNPDLENEAEETAYDLATRLHYDDLAAQLKGATPAPRD